MPEKKPKPKKTKVEPKLVKTTPVTQFKIPARYVWGESPLELAGANDAEKTIKAKKPDANLQGTVVGEFVCIRNEDCDETFIIHKDVLAELALAAG